MKITIPLLLTGSIIALATAPPTQSWDRPLDMPNPVPTRVETSYYGEFANPGRIQVECFIDGEETSTIRVTGGEPGKMVMLFCANEPAEYWLAPGLFLVSPTCAQIPGVFDSRGMFEIPVNLGWSALRGKTFYMQAMEWSSGSGELGWGFKLRVAAGNPQPQLTHFKPSMQAILCKNVSKFIPTLYSTLVRFEAPSSYHSLTIDGPHSVPGSGISSIYVTLTSDGEPWGPNKWHRAVVDLGPHPEPFVEVWVNLDHGGSCQLYKLGAWIHTEF